MPSGNTVSIVFAGDSAKLEKAFDRVGKGAKEMAGDLDKAEGKSKSFGKAMDKAGEAADHSEGKFMGAADLLDGLGGAFGLPTEGATNMMRSFGDLSGGISSLGPSIGKLGSMFSSLAMGPVGLIIAGIALLGAALYLLWTKSETFRDIVTGVWEWIQDKVGPIIKWIGEKIGWVAEKLGLHKEEVEDTGEAYKAMADNLRESLDAQQGKWQEWKDRVTQSIDGIMSPLQRARDQAKITFQDLKNHLLDNIRFFEEWQTNLQILVNRGFGALASKMFELGPTAATAVAEMAKGTDKELRHVETLFTNAGNATTKAFLGGFMSTEAQKNMGNAGAIQATSFKDGFAKGLGVINVPMNRVGPAVPHLAEGGIVRSPTLAVIGESGPEAVVPLGGGGGMGTGGPTVIQLVLDGRVITEVVHSGLLQKQRRTPLGIT